MIKLIKKIIKRFLLNYGSMSYSQSGEDIIIRNIFDQIGIKNPKYIDIGAHHPTLFSNTYLFYKNGSSGLCIEPDPRLFKRIQNKRKRDTCLNIGISSSYIKNAPYYIMTAKTLNTFSKEDSEQVQKAVVAFGKQKVEKIEYIDLIPVKNILKDYFNKFPDILSIDTEGLDEEIIKGINFNEYRPKVICIEVIEQTSDNKFIQNKNIFKIMEENGYKEYANTHINSIFIDKNINIL